MTRVKDDGGGNTYAEEACRCERLLGEGAAPALEQAAEAARLCVKLDKTRLEGYLLLTAALTRLHRHEDAVSWYKKGLEQHPDNRELQAGLKAARVAVLNNLLEVSDDEDEEEIIYRDEEQSWEDGSEREVNAGVGEAQSTGELEAEEIRTTLESHSSELVTQPADLSSQDFAITRAKQKRNDVLKSGGETRTTVFEAKMGRILEHLDLLKLARLAVLYIFTELLNLRRVALGVTLLFLGLLTHAVMHRQKLMVVSMLAICLYRSQLKERGLHYIHNWVQTSTDKLGAFTWAPRVLFVIPVVLKVIGQLKFMLFLQQDIRLGGLVTGVTTLFVANASRSGAGEHAKLWGEGRRLKFAAYFTAIAYWAGWRGELMDTTRLLAPAFIDAAGIVLGSISSSEIQEVCRRGLKRLYTEMADEIQTDVDLDVWFFLGLSNWVVEYWQQPTDFSLEMLTKMLSDCFDTMEKTAVRVFTPELRHLRDQLTDMQVTGELALLVAYLKRSLNNVPPPRPFGLVALVSKRCPSFVVFALLVVFNGIISLPLLPFIASEARDAQELLKLHRSGKLQKKDGLELLLLGSPLVRVWKNVQACIYCLEGSVTLSTAVATGTHIVSAASRISRLAAFASRVKKEGVFANAGEIPDHLSNAFLATKDSSLIIDGVRFIYKSSQFQDLRASVWSWWNDKASSESDTKPTDEQTEQRCS